MSDPQPPATDSPEPVAPDRVPPAPPAGVAEDGAPRPENAGMEALARGLRVSFALLIGAMLIGILSFFWRSKFVVNQQEVGLVLRFGKLVGERPADQVLKPGLHVTWPHPVDEKITVEMSREQTVDTGKAFMYTETESGVPAALMPGVDGYVVTGDMNIIHCKWTVRYQITDPIAYSFRCYDSATGKSQLDALLVALTRDAVLRAAAGLAVDDAWRNRDGEYARRVEAILAPRIKALNLGIEIKLVSLDSGAATPPRQTATAFTAVTRAEEERRGARSEAESFATRTLNEATAQSARVLAEANAYRVMRENKAAAEAKIFAVLLAEYRENPTVLRQRLHQDALLNILTRVNRKFVIKNQDGRQLRLELDRGPDVKRDAVVPDTSGK